MSTTTIAILNAITKLWPHMWPHILTFLFTFFALFGFLKWHYKKEKRLFKNLSRPFEIYTISDNPKSMETEINMIKKNQFFNKCPDRTFKDIENTVLSEDLSLVILAIDAETKEEDFNKALEKISSLKKPLIIYTLGDRKINWMFTNSNIKKYALHAIATTPLRLVSDMFTILSTYKNDK